MAVILDKISKGVFQCIPLCFFWRRKAKRATPLVPELMPTTAQKFREDWTYNTNAIEGNTMTFQ
ncbi:hypothetical protein SAMN02745133_00963 [Desulforamulus putei DSM 12395]|uniref:Uncharacterized protein n=1 Tax=Desulforamulus putei DSM 12395 TaxID=1121429 RepID=A0A1M4VKD7_9FIRM|nr:hypothetical protein SAMN02745133_00963 [Desulforamulus putei DSM 12395]